MLNMDKLNIKVIFFDIGSTLYEVKTYEKPKWATLVSLELGKLGYNIDYEEILEAYKLAREDLKSIIIPVELWHLAILSLMLNTLNIIPKPKIVRRVYKAFIKALTESFYIDPEALKVFTELKDLGLRIGIISNSSSDDVVYEVLLRDGLLSYVDVLVTSQQVSWKKPNPRIFHYACKLASVEPREAAHVGDDPYADVIGAKTAGLYAIQKLTINNKASPYADYVIHKLSELLDILT